MLEALDLAWDSDEGFLGQLRSGRFLAEAGAGYLVLLQSIEVKEGERLHADFVRLTWFAPMFMEWNVERAVNRGADKESVHRIVDQLRERIMELLGTP
ncbi:hypothetical protein ACFPM7_04000 [Actinokineospora guangxiensis]|uniref:Uncharacterized protein n=1 Tax=Actinokineospora guangxiensis TaxID=1490288 RepID=A0ABW0EJ48_9PSEU